MAELVWKPNRSAMRSFLAGPQGPAYTAVRRMQDKTGALADRLVPTDTGTLKGAQVKTPIIVKGKSVVGGVEYESPYGMFVHEGTRPHVIRPKRGNVLAFTPRGSSTVFAREVNHPGTKGQPWLRTSLSEAAKSEGFIVSQD